MTAYLPLEVKLSGAGTFTAYASTFNGEPDTYGDVVAPGSFRDTIEQHRKAGTKPALLWHHASDVPIGVIDSLYEDAKGLRIDGTLALDVAKGREAYALMKLGALSMSIGFRAIRSSKLGKTGRRLEAVQLFEVSAVAMPANYNAKVLSVKASAHPGALEFIQRANTTMAKVVLSQKIIAAARQMQHSI